MHFVVYITVIFFKRLFLCLSQKAYFNYGHKNYFLQDHFNKIVG